jgi:hypothetical protein
MMHDPRGYQRLVLVEDNQEWIIAAFEEAVRHGVSTHNGVHIDCLYVPEKDAVLCAACQTLVGIHDPRRN